MHDIDRTLSELEAEYEDNFQTDDDFEFESEYELEDDFGEDSLGEYEFEDVGDESMVLSDAEEMELASDLLNVTSDAELEQFLGKLFRRVKRGARKLVRHGRRFLKSGVGRQLAGVLRGVARQSLPMLGQAVGGALGGPAGAIAGRQAAPLLGRIFGLELEGLSPEDQEFEAAKRVVRLGSDAIANAAVASQTGAGPSEIVRRAVAKAARKHAPGLLSSSDGALAAPLGRRHSGRWVRRGNKIVLMGV